MQRNQWAKLNKQQRGAYAEYFVKMELTMFDFQVYRAEVDDRGIDFVARRGTGAYIQVQVKSFWKTKYVFMQKCKFDPAPDLYLALVKLADGAAPKIFLIPSLEWNSPNALFCDRPYGDGKKSKPEWGLNLSARNSEILEQYRFEHMIDALSGISPL